MTEYMKVEQQDKEINKLLTLINSKNIEIKHLNDIIKEKDKKIDTLSEIYFDEWYQNNKGRFHCGQLNERDMIKTAFFEGLELNFN